MVTDTKWGLYLPTAGLVIGWVNVGICALEFMYIIFLLSTIQTLDTRNDHDEEDVKIMVYILLGVYLVFIFIDFIASMMLVIGITQNKSSIMLPWLIINAISIAWKVVSILYLMTMWLITFSPPLKNMVYFFFNLLYTVLHCWLWLVVDYLYLYIQSKE